MRSLTPLHETYCKWDRTPPSQADVLEGIAQLVSTPVNTALRDFIQTIQREVISSVFGISQKKSRELLKNSYIQKFYQVSFDSMQNYGSHFIAPSLRRIIEKFPNLHNSPLTPKLHFLVGALNGVLGDYLLKHHNPIGLPMVLYDHYGSVQKGELSGHVILFVHGLCMNHLDWSHHQYGGIGEKLLAQRAHNTMLYLNYNTGRRISANGRSLANTLEDLVRRNPQISQISIIGHSMGGLVARSALFYGKQNMYEWLHMTENLVCLGSPHHGAMLERLGFSLQDKLGRFPIVKVAGHIVNIRSNGILDLRHGSVRDDDWEHNDARIGFMDDNRKPAPLPSHINTYLVAGTIENEKKNNRTRKAIGDYLVSVKSALGEHPNPRFQLKVPESHKAIFYGLNHFEIHTHLSVAEQIAQWFYPPFGEKDLEHIHEHIINLENYDGIALT
jgi:pimeloyl-ACP methyl ester carboxylesterase